MQRLQRTMGRVLPRTADESQVAVLLKDFEDVDTMLDRLIVASKAWRDAWRQILMRQQRIAAEFDGLYGPIVGSGENYSGPVAAETPDHILNRSMKLSREYTELEMDMKEEVDEMDLRVIKPAEDAKMSIQPMKKVIKKRQDRKLDYERYQHRFDSSAKKIGRSDRENRAMNKHEGDLSRTKEEYQEADQKLRECLPPLLQSVFSLLPYILASQITIQNNLLGHCYTQLSQFCQDEGLPVPAPDFAAIIQAWEADFYPVKDQIEGLNILRKGKVVHQPMKTSAQDSEPATRRPSAQSRSPSGRFDASPSRRRMAPSPNRGMEHSPARSDNSSHTARSIGPPSPNLANKPSFNRTQTNTSTSSYEHGKQRMLSVPDQGPLAQAMPNYANNNGNYYSNGGGTTPDNLSAAAPAGPNADYFSRVRTPSYGNAVYMSPPASTPSAAASTASSPAGSISSTLATQAAIAAKKKKPPPPPPPKRKVSSQGTFVTALYDFVGQGQGDLTFREGDKIKVIKRTDSTQDWWEGELGGQRGQFPANYVQVA